MRDYLEPTLSDVSRGKSVAALSERVRQHDCACRCAAVRETRCCGCALGIMQLVLYSPGILSKVVLGAASAGVGVPVCKTHTTLTRLPPFAQ